MLLTEQELVMGKPQKKYDPSQEQEQEQANLQGQIQGQANLQGQLQGQGQGQGQSETQTAAQTLKSDSTNNNTSSNDSTNNNHNTDTNSNTNSNTDTNHLNNSVSNEIDNKVSTCVDTHVNVDVNVDVSAHTPTEPVIDLQNFSANDALIMPEVVNQTLYGGGNIFHLDQVNNLIGDTKIEDASVSYSAGGACYDPSHGFSMDAKVDGGDSKIDGAHMGNAVGAGAGIVSHADAALTQSAFTQTITTGANIQFNSATIQAAGHDLTDDHHTI
jgi:hypothetical protein